MAIDSRIQSSVQSEAIRPGVVSAAVTAFNNEINTVRELVDRRANTQPDLPFLISPETGRVLTFKGLQEQAHHLSRRFRQMGLEFGDKVAFLMDNGLFTAQLFLGAMYGGFVSVPLSVRRRISIVIHVGSLRR
jgi:acyl-CoA synthetase (AMP-forming)/AMP-acid ligase II